jgi:hypothetical protein
MELQLFSYSLSGQRFPGLLRFNLPKMIRQQYQQWNRNCHSSLQRLHKGRKTARRVGIVIRARALVDDNPCVVASRNQPPGYSARCA